MSIFHIIYPLSSITDGPARWASRRIQDDFTFFCCGALQIYQQESCAAAFVHFGGINFNDFGFGLGGGSFDDLFSEFGFDVSSPDTTGDVYVSRHLSDDFAPGDVPYLTGLYVHKTWLLSGNVNPLEGQDTPPDTTKITRYRFHFTDNDLLSGGIDPSLKSQIVVGRLDGANLGMTKWTLDVGSAESVDTVQDFVRVDNPKSFGQWAIGLPSAFAPDNPGVLAPTIKVDKVAGGGLRISWDPSCANQTVNYGIYQGVIGSWSSHVALDCDDASSDYQEVVTPGGGNRYFLVVPLSNDAEGSYGTNSGGIERPRGATTCRALQMPGSCSSSVEMEVRKSVGAPADSTSKEECP